MFRIFLTALSSKHGDAMPLLLEINTFCKMYNRDQMNTVMYAKYDCTAKMNNDLERGETYEPPCKIVR